MSAPKRQRIAVSVTLDDGSVLHDPSWDMYVAKDALAVAVERKLTRDKLDRKFAADVDTKEKAAAEASARILRHVQAVFPNAVKVHWYQSGDLEPIDRAQYYERSWHNLSEVFDLEYRLRIFISFATPKDTTCNDNEAALRLTYDATLKAEATDNKVYFEFDSDDFSLDVVGWQTDTVNPSADDVCDMLIELIIDEAPDTPASILCKKLEACNMTQKLAARPRFID